MKCDEINFGAYDCTYDVMLPYKVKSPWIDDSQPEWKFVSIDKCLLKEIIDLWEMGIKTTGCCCGHGNINKSYIGVKEENIQKMKDLGYVVYPNNCRIGAEDSFVPKTSLVYGEINKGFSRCEE